MGGKGGTEAGGGGQRGDGGGQWGARGGRRGVTGVMEGWRGVHRGDGGAVRGRWVTARCPPPPPELRMGLTEELSVGTEEQRGETAGGNGDPQPPSPPLPPIQPPPRCPLTPPPHPQAMAASPWLPSPSTAPWIWRSLSRSASCGSHRARGRYRGAGGGGLGGGRVTQRPPWLCPPSSPPPQVTLMRYQLAEDVAVPLPFRLLPSVEWEPAGR